MPGAIALDLRSRREAVIRAHADAENRQDVEATLMTFHRPRYEVVPLGEPIDGAANVRELLKGLLEGFPDFHAAIDRYMELGKAGIACTIARVWSRSNSGCSARIAGLWPASHRPAAASTFPP